MKADFGVDTQVQNCWVQNMASGSIAEYGSMSFQRDCTNSQFPCICESTPCSIASTLANVKLESCYQNNGCEMAFQCFNLQFSAKVKCQMREIGTYIVYWTFDFTLVLSWPLVVVSVFIGSCVGIPYIL